MADPTASDIDNGLTLVDGGSQFAQDEILRLLRTNYPVTAARWNTLKGWTIPTPPANNYLVMPAMLEDRYINSICVDCDETKNDRGSGRWDSVLNITVAIIGARATAKERVDDTRRGAALCLAILRPCFANWHDPNGVTVWGVMVPNGIGKLSPQWAPYSGHQITLTAKQYPGDNGWKL